MKIYYVGKLLLCDYDNENISSKFKLTLHNYEFNILDVINKSKRLNQNERDYLINNINIYRNAPNGIADEKIVNILNKANISFHYEFNNNPIEIIYEIIEDESGKCYGKELFTGLIFPIIKNPDIEYYYTYDSSIGSKNIYKICTYFDENLIRFKYALMPTDVASTNKINEYKPRGTSNRKIEKLTTKINVIYNENVFKKEIIEKNNQPFEKKDETVQLMEDIEYLLLSLKQYNYSLYLEFKECYENIYNKYKNYSQINYKDNYNDLYNSYNPLKKELLDLLSNIKLHLAMNSKGCSNLLEYLNVLVEEYLDEIINKEPQENQINIKFLDKINDLFLKDKNRYDLTTQRMITKKITLLYLLIVKNNNYSTEQLDKSYFKENIKSIILNIMTLYDLGIIKNIPQINFNDELSIEDLLTIINNSELCTMEERHKAIIKTKFDEFFIH